MATIYMKPEKLSNVRSTDIEHFDEKKILQPIMNFVDADIGKYAVAIKLNDCDMGHWYFLNPDPSGTIWGHGWDEANTLSDCFTLFDSVGEAKSGLEHLKSLRGSSVSASGIFQVLNDDTLANYIELKHI